MNVAIKQEEVLGGERIKHIQGSGGGGKGGASGAAGNDDPNSLRSIARARVLFCLGEGQVEGYTQGDLAKSVRIDGTPLQSPDGSFNYNGFSLEWRNGSPDQSYIPGFEEVRSEERVAREVRNGLPVTETIFDPNTDAAVVRMRLPSLREITDSGIKGTRTRYIIEYAPAGESYETVVDQTFEDKADSPYERSHEFRLNGRAPWDIRVVRGIDDSDDVRLENRTIFQALTTVQYKKRRYPNAALLAVDIDASQFSSSPRISVDMRGLRVLVPHNYDPYKREYSGAFDGSLVPKWTSNPVWIVYDLLTDDRYGAGISPDLIDVYAFYSAATYCDEKINNGEGGLEPRFTFNATITTRGEAYKIAESVASNFNGKLVPAGSRIGLLVDKPQSISQIYGPERVVIQRDKNGVESDPFVYEKASLKDVRTVAIVSYREPNQKYAKKELVVVDEVGYAKWGRRVVRISAFGCTSRTQARRFGLWKLLTDRLQSQIVTFKVATEGLLVSPGEVVGILDPSRTGVTLTGRLSEVDSDRVILDKPMRFYRSSEYSLTTSGSGGMLQKHKVDISRTNTELETKEVIVEEPFAELPVEESGWSLETRDVKPVPYRITSISELKDGNYEMVGVLYNESKYDAIENDAETIDTTTLTLPDPLARPSRPEDLVVTESLGVGPSGEIVSRIDIGWSYPEAGYLQLSQFEVEYQREGDFIWTSLPPTRNRSYAIDSLPVGNYGFRVTAVNRLGLRGPSLTANSSQVRGLMAPPKAVDNLRIIKTDARTAFLRWNYVVETDVRKGGYHLVKHSPKLSGATWKDGEELERVQGHQNQAQLEFREGTYMVRTFDSSNQESTEVASVVTRFAFRDPNNVLKIFQESPAYPGVQDKVSLVNESLRLVEIERVVNIPAPISELSAPLIAYGTRTENVYVSEGFYYLSEKLNLGASYPVYLYSALDSSVFARTDAIALQPAPISALPASYFQGSNNKNPSFSKSPSATIQIAISLDGVTYADWIDFSPGEYILHSAKFRVRLETNNSSLTVEVNDLQIIADVPDRQESGRTITSSNTPTLVSYSAGFLENPMPQFTVLNSTAGDRVILLSESKNGMTIEVRNELERVARDVTWTARGFGKAL